LNNVNTSFSGRRNIPYQNINLYSHFNKEIFMMISGAKDGSFREKLIHGNGIIPNPCQDN
jgi:hypothetical protein